MDIGQVNAELDRLNTSVTARLAAEVTFKRNVYDKINTILNSLIVCAGVVASAPPGASAAAVQDFTRQVTRLRDEIARLDDPKELSDIEAQYLVQPLGAEARSQNLRWHTPVNKTTFSTSTVPYALSSTRGGWTPKRKNPKRRPRTFRR
jgi:hypothetical protein